MIKKGTEEKVYRYVCKNCLRTFLKAGFDNNLFCWKCGQDLKIIPDENEFTDKRENDFEKI